MKQRFNITGMTCSACSNHIEKAVNKISGIKEVNVNLLTNSMTVNFDDTVTISDIINTVINNGYGASVSDKMQEEVEKLNKKDKKTKVDTNTYDRLANKEINEMKKRLIISFIFLIPLMYISMGHMMNFPLFSIFHGIENMITFSLTQALLTIPIIFVNRKYFIGGFKSLLKGSPNMDTLIAIGSTSAVVYGVFAIYMIGYGLGVNNVEIVEKYMMNIYFESAGTILTLITLGKYLEIKSKGKTLEAISKLIELAPKTATVIRNEKTIEIASEDIILGDIVVIKPGEKIPVDGIVVSGLSYVDQSAITGESIPVKKEVGDNVISATINKSGSFEFKAQKIGEDTTISQIIRLVEEASSSKAPISKIADRISGVFVPIVILISIISVIIWLIMGQTYEFALSIGIAVLVISCPCALGLATPVSIMVGTGKGAQNGILIKSGEALETLHQIDTIVLDKTGTITEGKPKVTDIICINETIKDNELMRIIASLEEKSEHPISIAILNKAKDMNIQLDEVERFDAILGKGVQGEINNTSYIAGNVLLMKENEIKVNDVYEKYTNQGKTVICIADNSKKELLGIVTISDTIKESSRLAIQLLKKMNIKTIIATGDNKNVAKYIADKVGIKEILSEVLPQDKERQIRELQEKGNKVAMVGDGINDSPALVRANVGIAIGAGTDIALESADVVLIKNDLLDVVKAILLSKKVINNIRGNLFWAFFYNSVGIPLAAGVLYNTYDIVLTPMIAAGAMSLSSICVVLNALRLKRLKLDLKRDNKNNQEGNNTKINNEKGDYMKKEIHIENMSCNHCKMAVENKLAQIEGIQSVEVNLDDKKAIVEFDKQIENIDEILKNMIEELGYEVTLIK